METEHLRKHVHNRLKIRLLIYILLALIILGWILFDIATERIDLMLPLVGLLAGTCIGILISRMYKISWDHNAEQVIARLDIYGVLILVIYIIFELERDRIVEYFIHGPAVAATSLALLGGTLFGRLIGMGGKISMIIQQNT